jgi:hypothetical protein
MTVREHLEQVLATLPERRQAELLDFARFLQSRDLELEAREWQVFGQQQFAKCYGPNEPEYTEADLKVKTSP